MVMNIYFSGIGGVALGPLAEIALDAGHSVSGSDISEGLMTEQLRQRGVSLSSDQSGQFLRDRHRAKPIDWLVYTAALPDDHPELEAARELGIKATKRDGLLKHVLKEKNLKLIAIAGTHGKTTTTGMAVWLAKYFGLPVSYCVGTTLSWAPSGKYVPGSEYFIYECDEFDRNFLAFEPFVSLITAMEHDHPDTYPTEAEYYEAFGQFARQSQAVFTWRKYEQVLGTSEHIGYVDAPSQLLTLPGEHNRENASLVLAALERFGVAPKYAADGLNRFPGTARRFEQLADNLYTDYGHTPSEIAATLQMARELAEQVVLVYEPHQNVRQHEIRDDYTDDIFNGAEKVYWLPTYLSREYKDLAVLRPEELSKNVSCAEVVKLDDELWSKLEAARQAGKLVLCMGAGTIDGWVRQRLKD